MDQAHWPYPRFARPDPPPPPPQSRATNASPAPPPQPPMGHQPKTLSSVSLPLAEQSTFTLGWGANHLLKNGWKEGQGLGKSNNRDSVPIDKLKSDLSSPGKHVVSWLLLFTGVFLAGYTADPSGLRKGTYPSVVTEETVKAWDWTLNPASANATTTLPARNPTNCVM